MGAYWLRLTTEEPLIIGQGKADSSFLTTIAYVPGRVLRGAWADWLLAQGKGNDIGSIIERARIWNFFPSREERLTCYTSPFLLSSLTCKREGGFLSEPEPDERGHGVVDVLLPELAYVLLSELYGPAAVPFAPRCNHLIVTHKSW
jgi:CRISPR-associated protein Csx10